VVSTDIRMGRENISNRECNIKDIIRRETQVYPFNASTVLLLLFLHRLHSHAMHYLYLECNDTYITIYIVSHSNLLSPAVLHNHIRLQTFD
jgi:hypothetical protein